MCAHALYKYNAERLFQRDKSEIKGCYIGQILAEYIIITAINFSMVLPKSSPLSELCRIMILPCRIEHLSCLMNIRLKISHVNRQN